MGDDLSMYSTNSNISRLMSRHTTPGFPIFSNFANFFSKNTKRAMHCLVDCKEGIYKNRYGWRRIKSCWDCVFTGVFSCQGNLLARN